MIFAKIGPWGIPTGTPANPTFGTAEVFAFDGKSLSATGEIVEVLGWRYPVDPGRMAMLAMVDGRWFVASADC